MPKAKLTTKSSIDALPLPKKGQEHYWCTDLRGFGVRVGVRDRTFVVQRDVNGKSRRVTIGRYGDITLAQARKRAEEIMGAMRGGIDPLAERRKTTANNMTLREAWKLYEGHLAAKERSPRTRMGYWKSIERYCSDWLERPLVEITPEAAHARHIQIGNKHGKYAANGTMRTVRAIWRRARRQHPGLGEPPTINVDWYKETPRKAVVAIADLPAWWRGVQSMENPIRRDFYIWLLFTGCRSTESATLRWEQVDLDVGTVHFPKTKTDPFDLPLSDFLIDLLSARRADEITLATFGTDCPWVFPSHSKTGHLAESKLSTREAKTIPVPFTPHLLRHTYITISENKVSIPSGHARLMVNHALAASGDAHTGYNHPDLDDLRRSQQAMTDFLRGAIWPEKDGKNDNVLQLPLETH